MNFNHLDSKMKQKLHEEVLSNANKLGGKNFFLQLIEDIKKEKTHPLLNKSSKFHFSKGQIVWTKSIYKDTLVLLQNTIRLVEKDENFFESLKIKAQKSTTNMMKALNPVSIEITPKDSKDGEGFTLSIIETNDKKKSEISMMYRIIFFYSADFAKDALNYKPEN